MEEPEGGGGHFLVEAGEPADDVAGDEEGEEGDAHQGGVEAGRGDAGDEGEDGGPVVDVGAADADGEEEGPDGMDFLVAVQVGDGGEEEVAAGCHGGGDGELVEVCWFSVAFGLPAPEDQQERGGGDGREGFCGEEPGDGDLEGAYVELDVLLEPDGEDVEGLEVAEGVEDGDHQDGDEEEEGGGVVLFVRLFLLGLDAGGEMFVAGEVSGEAAEHEDSGYGEGGVPAVVVRDETAGERAGEGADLDGGREDGEAFGAEEFVSCRVEGADLGGDVALEEAGAEDEAEEGKEEGLLEGHGEVADGHEDGTEDDGVAVAEPAVCDEAAEDGGEVDEAAVEAEDAGGEGLGGEGAGEGFDCGAEGGEAGDVGGVSREEEVVDHEEHEEGAHAVVGEALPGFCEGEIEEAAGVAEYVLRVDQRGGEESVTA